MTAKVGLALTKTQRRSRKFPVDELQETSVRRKRGTERGVGEGKRERDEVGERERKNREKEKGDETEGRDIM